jgi:predicted transcriptional regulator
MDTAINMDIVRKNLHHYIETVDDKKVYEIYTELENDIMEDINAYNRDIEEAEQEIARGNFYTHEQALNEIKSWENSAK